MKILTLQETKLRVQGVQQAGKSVVLCHGCFDIVHPGHIRHLQHAASLGDHLLVTITGDGMVDKGTGRPLIPQDLRAENLAALDCVDWVTVNVEQTAVDLLEMIRPDIFVKGREYEDNHDPRFVAEKEVVERYGGRVVFTSGDVVFSSTALIDAMAQTTDPMHRQIHQLLKNEDFDAKVIDRMIDDFRDCRVAVVGEAIIDTYVMCDRPDIASEVPVMSLRPLEYRNFDGGAAIIARHLAAMGARPTLITALPRSTQGEALRQRLESDQIEVRAIKCIGQLIEKQRFLVGNTKVMKLDLGEPLTLDAAEQERLITLVEEVAATCDALIIADFGLGLFTQAMMLELCRRVRSCVPFIAGDVSGRRSNLLAMHDVDLLCPSEQELRDALHEYDDGLGAVAWQLLHCTKARSAIVTLGGEGATVFRQASSGSLQLDDCSRRLATDHIPALAPNAIDQLGCGDALLAAATLTSAVGGSVTMGALLGSVAAAAQSKIIGNTVIDAAELRHGFNRFCGAHLHFQGKSTTSQLRMA